jgi:hypothetical protein
MYHPRTLRLGLTSSIIGTLPGQYLASSPARSSDAPRMVLIYGWGVPRQGESAPS